MTFKLQDPLYNEALRQFLQFCKKNIYPAKTPLIRSGEKGDRLYFILSGSVSVRVEDPDGGHELILAYLNKNEFIGEIGVFKPDEKRKVSVTTRTECCLAEIRYERLFQILKGELANYETDIIYIIVDQLSSRLLNTNQHITDLAFLDVKGRIARILLELSKSPEAVPHPDGMQLHISRQELGRMVSCSREMAGRILKELDRNDLISAKGKTIVIFDTRGANSRLTKPH